MALFKRNIWLIYYILLGCTVLLLGGASVTQWQDMEDTYRLRQTNLIDQWYGNLNSLMLQQETIMDVLGQRVAAMDDPLKMTRQLDRLESMNPELFSGFGLTWPSGEIAAISSGLKEALVLNLTQLNAARDSFLYSMTQDKMVLGRPYAPTSAGVVLPFRKAIRDNDGKLIAIMSGSFWLDTFRKTFTCDPGLPECADIKIIRSRDRYPLVDSSKSSSRDYYNYAMNESEYQRLLAALNWDAEQGYKPYAGKPYSYLRRDRNDNSLMGIAIYDERYEYWLVLEVEESRFLAEVRRNVLIYMSAFIVFNICLFLLFRMIHSTEEKRRQELLYQANHDTLTGLPNRNNLQQIYDRWREPPNHSLALQFIDMNNFKGVNDSFGHECGDRVLKEIARRIRKSLNEDDLVFRLGGDEFVVISPFVNEKTTLENGRHLIAEVTDTYSVDGRHFMLGASMGIARFPEDGRNLDQLLRSADISMYEAKRQRMPVCFFEDRMQDTYLRNIAIEHLLRTAVINNEIYMMYQPQVDSTGKFIGVECLVRWENETMGGRVPPDQFIPVAEQAGLMPELGTFILQRSLQEMAAIQNETALEFSVSVNISVRQFLHEGFLSSLLQEINRSGMKHVLIVLEITESIFIEDMQQIVELITAIHEKGIRISMDDFGTGYSSLSLLHKLPVDELKIDRSFVEQILDDINAQQMVQSIIAIGRNRSITLLAEGVESEEQAQMLRDYGCDSFQGYYFARPLLIDELRDYLQDKVLS